MKRATVLLLASLCACQSEPPRQSDPTPVVELAAQVSPSVAFPEGPRVLTEPEQAQFYDATATLLCLTLGAPDSGLDALSPERADDLRRALVKFDLDAAGLELRLRAYHRHQAMQEALTARLQTRCPGTTAPKLDNPLEILPLEAMQRRQGPLPTAPQAEGDVPAKAKPYLLAFAKLSCMVRQADGDLQAQRAAVLKEGGWTDETWIQEGARWRDHPQVVSACARALRACATQRAQEE